MVDISNVKHKKPDFLKTKFEMEYLTIAVGCAGLLVIMVALPYISIGYDLWRLYSLARVILSVCFVIGGMTLSKHFLSKETFMTHRDTHEHENNNVFSYQRTCAKKECTSFVKAFLSKNRFVLKEKGQKSLIKNFSFKKKALPKKQKEGRKDEMRKGKGNRKSALQARAYLIILLILIPYSMFTSGLMYQLFGVSGSIILNSEGEGCDYHYVHDQESYGAKWLGNYAVEGKKMYADFYGNRKLVSQGKITPTRISHGWLSNPQGIDGYIYLRYHNVVNGKLVNPYTDAYNMTDYQGIFFEKNEVYDSGCTKILR